MKVLITGGSGYLGSQLIFKLLKKNFDIQILDLYPPPSPLIKIIDQFNNCEYVLSEKKNEVTLARNLNLKNPAPPRIPSKC